MQESCNIKILETWKNIKLRADLKMKATYL